MQLIFSFLFLFLQILRIVATTVPIEGVLQVPFNRGTSERPQWEWSGAPDLEITLNGHQYMTRTRTNGTFVFHNVPTGVYLLDVLSIHELFPQLKVKVNAETGLIRLAEYKYPGGKRLVPTYPIVLKSLSTISYYQEHPPFSIYSFIVGNPMIIMMVVSFLIIFGFPALMANLSEEEIQEMEKNNASSNPMELLQGMLTGKGAPTRKDSTDGDD